LGIYTSEDTTLHQIGIGYILAPDLTYPGIGQYILDKEKIGKGFGSLAIHGLSRLVLEQLDRLLVQAITLGVNEPSKRSLARAGFFQTDPRDPTETSSYGPSLEIDSPLRTWLYLNLETTHYLKISSETLAKRTLRLLVGSSWR